MNNDEIVRVLHTQLDQKRYEHTLRVRDTALELAKRFDINQADAERAALLHDYAKCRPKEELYRWIIEERLPKDLLAYHHELWHGPVGSLLVQKELDITNQTVIDAICYHTTGRPYMNDIDMVVFVADYIEPARDFPGLEDVRDMAQKDLVHAAWMVAHKTNMYLLGKKVTLYPDSIHTYNELTNRLKQGDVF